MPAMEFEGQRRARGNGALGAVRREWPHTQPEQHPIPAQWEDERIDAAAAQSDRFMQAVPLSMSKAALHSVLSGIKR